MIFKNQNMMKNYKNANGSGDETLKRDVLTSEIAKLIVYEPKKVVELLNQAGYQAKQMQSSRALANAVTKALHESQKFAELLAKAMIAKNETEMFSGAGDEIPAGVRAPSIADPDPVPVKKKTSFLDMMKSASDVIGGLGTLFGGKTKAKADASKSKSEADKARAEADRAKTEANRDLLDKIRALKGLGKNNTGLVIGLIVTGLAVGGTVLYFIFRKK